MTSQSTFSSLLIPTLLSVLTLGCAAGRKQKLDLNENRPPVDQNGFVRHAEEVTIQVPRPFLLEFQHAGPLESKLRGTNQIAGVARVEMIRGTWGEVGARRLVVRKDGNQSLEEVLEHEPTLFRYEVWGFTDRASILANYLVGEFQYREAPGGTVVTWTYSFHRRSPVTEPILAFFVRTRIVEFMHSTIERMKQGAEQAYRERPDQVGSKTDSAARR
jgi:Polyketide cyclase / dehydrase and lipid transport